MSVKKIVLPDSVFAQPAIAISSERWSLNFPNVNISLSNLALASALKDITSSPTPLRGIQIIQDGFRVRVVFDTKQPGYFRFLTGSFTLSQMIHQWHL